MTDEPRPDPGRPRRAIVALATGVVLLLVAGASILVVRHPTEVFTTVAAADATPAPVETVVVTAESTTTTTVPETTTELPPPTTLPPPNPGPPVWPSTGAQGQKGKTVSIYNAMNGRVIRTLSDPWGAIPSHPAFRVIQQKGEWLEVSLPLRPNESKGWIKADDVNLYPTNISIDVDLDARWLTVYDKDATVISAPVVIGTPATPTPKGNFFVTDLIPNPGGPFGTYAFGLSGRSNVLNEFAGGDGQIAIHGTNQPQLMTTASSHGCVRVTNETANRLAKGATVGIPIHIH